jgi:hypothetical protein
MSSHPNKQRRTALSLAVIACLPPVLASCGGAAIAVVPFITFAFEGVITVNAAGDLQVVQVSLDNNATQQGKSSGTFDSPTLSTRDTQGNQLQTFGSFPPSKPISGSFDGNSLNLSLPGALPPLATAYSGEFIAADTIMLTPVGGGLPTIKLLRVDNSFRPNLDGSKWTGKNGNGDSWTITFTTQQIGLAAELLTATTDVLAGQAGTWKGFAEMRDLEVTVTRGATVTTLTGTFGPAGTTPPGSTQSSAQTLTFPDGSALTRDP